MHIHSMKRLPYVSMLFVAKKGFFTNNSTVAFKRSLTVRCKVSGYDSINKDIDKDTKHAYMIEPKFQHIEIAMKRRKPSQKRHAKNRCHLNVCIYVLWFQYVTWMISRKRKEIVNRFSLAFIRSISFRVRSMNFLF